MSAFLFVKMRKVYLECILHGTSMRIPFLILASGTLDNCREIAVLVHEFNDLELVIAMRCYYAFFAAICLNPALVFMTADGAWIHVR